MKAVFAVVALLLACGPLQAQTEPKKDPKDQKAIKKADTARPAEPEHRHSGHPPKKERPPQTRETSEGTVKLDRARPQETQRPSSPPSPAQQMQQQQYEQRQQQSQQPNQPSNASRVVQCNARPVCGGGGYGRCAGVAQTYQGATLQSGRRAIVQNCIDANTPDSCNCAAQCTAVARCSIF
jgi:outer membrane biosynthesis protein TonB